MIVRWWSSTFFNRNRQRQQLRRIFHLCLFFFIFTSEIPMVAVKFYQTIRQKYFCSMLKNTRKRKSHKWRLELLNTDCKTNMHTLLTPIKHKIKNNWRAQKSIFKFVNDFNLKIILGPKFQIFPIQLSPNNKIIKSEKFYIWLTKEEICMYDYK